LFLCAVPAWPQRTCARVGLAASAPAWPRRTSARVGLAAALSAQPFVRRAGVASENVRACRLCSCDLGAAFCASVVCIRCTVRYMFISSISKADKEPDPCITAPRLPFFFVLSPVPFSRAGFTFHRRPPLLPGVSFCSRGAPRGAPRTALCPSLRPHLGLFAKGSKKASCAFCLGLSA
jgi:hypothetical protein